MKALTFLAAFCVSGAALAATHPFNVTDLVMMDRVGSPALSPDGATVAFSVRSTQLDENTMVSSLWTVPSDGGQPVKRVGSDLHPGAAAWAPDGTSLYFLGSKDGSRQLWRLAVKGDKPEVVSDLPVGINGYRISPDGSQVLMSIDVFTDCPAKTVLQCTRERLDQRKADKASGQLYDKMFVRHWDHWMDGRNAQLFVAAVKPDGSLGQARWITQGIDGDIPSRPFGGNSEYVFSPDGKTVYFDVRIAGHSEPWSTNFDVYRVPADGSAKPENLTAANKAWDAHPLVSHDGKTLYYLAMATPGFEADRFAIMAMDLATGETREVDPDWDRSAGPLQLSTDGKTLYTTAADEGNTGLFAVDIASGKVTPVWDTGTVAGFAVGNNKLVMGHQDFQNPTALYTLVDGKREKITHFNDERLASIQFSDADWFSFKGWNGDTVHGYVMKPVGYEKGKTYPVAFIVHGGPQGAWSNEFHYRWNPEIWAGQGFAVVAINFHGSVGYGQAFTNAISGHWGDRPLEDLKKGWQAALDNYDYLDADRACALGASYGGYMVYWMAGVWNKPWKCMVDHDGVFDTRIMYYATEELWFMEHENGGKPEYANPAPYEKFNPINHVADWRVPMLVIHSRLDFRIPLSQGLSAFTALQRQGIPSQFLYFPDESHIIVKPKNKVQWLNTINSWIKRWTAPTEG